MLRRHIGDARSASLRSPPLQGLVAIVLVCALAGETLAQYGSPPPPPPPGYGYAPPEPPGVVRDGVVIGAALGLGVISNPSCDECDGKGGLALALRLGGMITPDMAILADLSGVFHGNKDDGVRQSLTHGLLAAALKWWIFEKAWIQGGLGAGRASESIQYDGAPEVKVERSGYGLLLGAGIEFLQTSSFVLDVQLRFVAVEYDGEPSPLTNTSVDLGFNWY